MGSRQEVSFSFYIYSSPSFQQKVISEMESSSPYWSLSLFLFLSLFPHELHCQQHYLSKDFCPTDYPYYYPCDGYSDSLMSSCSSYLSYKLKPPYDTTTKIQNLFRSRSPNTINDDSIKIVEVLCLCYDFTYQARTLYGIKSGDTFNGVANNIFQGLTSCSKLGSLNYEVFDDLSNFTGTELVVPLRCACPTPTQMENGVRSLIVYMVEFNDTIPSIAMRFGIDVETVLQANKLSNSSSPIDPFTPILLPLKKEDCTENSTFSFCQWIDNSTELPENFPDYRENRKPPIKMKLVFLTATGVGSGIALLILVLGGYKVYQLLKERRHKLTKVKFFKQNGGHLLQQKLEENERKVKIFTKEELERATDNFSQSRFLGQGGYGTVYKGMLKDGTTVAVKRSKQIETNWINQFINEVAILSQINHRNVVKLLGCCLETKFPLLVYEFVPNGTLSNHIHESDPMVSSPLSWDSRLRIASEISGAISYMHSAASIPIFHRDIKSMNILLDDNYSAKVSDFGTSRFVPCDQSHLTTRVQGTLGYIDPEFFRSNQYTEKSDVYSFGVLMVELLTGKTPFTFAKDQEGGNLLEYFISLENDSQLIEILDIAIAKEASVEVVHSVAKLAIKCLRLNGKKRPTMKQVFLEIEGLRKSRDCSETVEESQSTRISSLHSASNSYEDLTDHESIISIDMEFR